MSVPVISPGTWSNNTGLNFGSAVSGRTYTANILIAFGGNPETYINKITNLFLTGPDAARFNANPSGFALPFNVGGAATVELPISFNPNSNTTFNAVLNITYQATITSMPVTIQFALTGTGVAPGTGEVGFNIFQMFFPGVIVGGTQNYPGSALVLINFSDVSITVNALALSDATDFTIETPPTLPLVIPAGGSSPPFSVQFNPTSVGPQTSTLTATLSTGATALAVFNGTSLQITPVYNLTGATQATLFGFAGVVDALNPASYDTEEPASLVRMSDYTLAHQEKEILRVRGHYQDFGPATITITATCRRVGKPDMPTSKTTTVSKDVAIGTTGATDGWLRDFIADLNIVDELIQLTISRAANSGPAFIVDYTPSFEPKGEVVEGT